MAWFGMVLCWACVDIVEPCILASDGERENERGGERERGGGSSLVPVL